MKQLAILITVGLTLASCAGETPSASQNEKVAVQTAKPSDADYDKYMQGMIDSDAQTDQGGEAN
jgi:PBP1b-binding outer membrane lipoprotein LpoB